MNITPLKYTFADLDQLSKFLAYVADTFYPFGRDPSPVDIASGIAMSDEAWLFKDLTGQITALGMLRGFDDHPMPCLGIAVNPGMQRMGLGRAMMMFLHYRAKERGATQVMLHVDDSNRGAQRLYESMGYRKMEDRWVVDLA